MFAVVYDDQATAEQAITMAKALESAGYATIYDQALIRKDEHGKAKLDEEKHPVRRGVVTGGVLGGILGLFFLAPAAGAAAGAALGGAVGHSEKSGAQDFKSFAEKIEREIPNGGAAIVLMGQTDARDRVVHDLGSYGGTVHSFDLKEEELAQLQREMNRAAQQ
jgi:uncharacterized membrane protein